MLNKNISFKNFSIKQNRLINKKIFKIYNNFIKEKSELIQSLSNDYENSYSSGFIKSFKKIKNFIIIGIGGSILGTKAIYNFLNPRKKKFTFIDNFSDQVFKNDNKKKLILIVSKSGNTLETISNTNTLINQKNKNIFITENKKSFLFHLANKLKTDVIYHNNFIGGRYSVLSEVGMLPAELMGFKPEKFRSLNELVKKKYFMNTLVQNVSSIYNLIKKKRTNSIILNYDSKSNDLFFWYQQLVAESLGKRNKGILPVVSKMPQDNHSLMQYYLEGSKNNFFTLFFVKEKNSKKIKKSNLLNSHKYLKNKSLNEISYSQFIATEKVFSKNKIPFRSIVINDRNEQTLGELFIFFILETILLGKLLKINPFNQPSVELIKNQTKKILISK